MSCNVNDDPAEDFKLRTKGNTEARCFVVSCLVEKLLSACGGVAHLSFQQHPGTAASCEALKKPGTEMPNK